LRSDSRVRKVKPQVGNREVLSLRLTPFVWLPPRRTMDGKKLLVWSLGFIQFRKSLARHRNHEDQPNPSYAELSLEHVMLKEVLTNKL